MPPQIVPIGKTDDANVVGIRRGNALAWRITMPLTDQSIEDMLMDAEDQIEMNGTYEIDGDDFKALLARLEAAEACAW